LRVDDVTRKATTHHSSSHTIQVDHLTSFRIPILADPNLCS